MRRTVPAAAFVLSIFFAAPVIAALLLLSLRQFWPSIGRDLKDVELAAGAAMAAAATALGWLWSRGVLGRLAGASALIWCVGWGLWNALHSYLARFVAVDS